MARVNGSGFKMKSSPTKKGLFSNFFSSLGAKKTDMGELRSKQARSSKGMSEFEYRKTKEYKAEKDYKKRTSGVNPDNKTKMVNVVVDGVVKSVPAEDRFKYESVRRVKSTPKTEKTEIPKQTFKQAFASAKNAGKETFEWKGNPYTTKLKEKKVKKTKINTKKDIIRNKIEMIDPSSEILDTLDEIKAYGSVKNKDVKKSFDFNKTNDYSSSAVKKKSPSKKRGYKMNRKK